MSVSTHKQLNSFVWANIGKRNQNTASARLIRVRSVTLRVRVRVSVSRVAPFKRLTSELHPFLYHLAMHISYVSYTCRLSFEIEPS